MKNNLLFILSFFFLHVAATNGQNPIPNYSFEDWTNGNPDGWFTDNSLFGIFVTEVSPGHTGNSAAKGEVQSVFGYNFPPQMYSIDTSTGSGFPVSQQYSTLYFWYKFNQVGTTSTVVAIDFLDIQDSVVGVGASYITSPATSFTLGSTPIYWLGSSPVSCIISITMIDTTGNLTELGNYFIIDDLSFDNAIGISEVVNTNYFFEAPTPNPASTSLTIDFGMPGSTDVDLKIYDVLGKELKLVHGSSVSAGKNSMNVDVSYLNAGTYILALSSKYGMLQRKLVVSR